MTALPLFDRLSIRLSADGFSFCTKCRPTTEGGQVTFEYTSLQIEPHISLAANVKQLLERGSEFPYRDGSFRRTDILMDVAGKYATVPLEIFEDDQADVIFGHLHQLRPGETVLYNVLDRSNIVVLFSMERSAHTLLKELFPTGRIWASISPVIEQLTTRSRMAGPRKTYIYLGRRRMDILVFEHGHPLLVNTFACRDAEDCVYYTLHAWNSLGLKQEQDELYLIGNGSSHKEQVFSELQKFIKQVTVVNPIAEFNRSEMAQNEQVPYDLLALWHCGL